ncbi:MAG TPA: carboxypeptidase-like regulatory domain-containing protein, partial [Gemmatimonadaceae bacterium]|nr:carboxypeptidase-like regulatory domain-containing protein [Gemmatimonadaceae bacterium]
MAVYFVLRRISPIAEFIAAAAMIVLLASPLIAQSSASVTGTVMSSANAPVVGAFVSIDSAPPQTQTDASGRFRVDGIAGGSHIVHVRRSGYTDAIS